MSENTVDAALRRLGYPRSVITARGFRRMASTMLGECGWSSDVIGWQLSHAKDILRMKGPFGSFFVREASAKPMILLASGTGFAPIKAIIEHLQFKHSQRHAELYWDCRSKAEIYLHDWAVQAAQTMPNLQYVPVPSEPKPEDAWTGRTGFVHHAVMHDHPNLMNHQVYACGMSVMIESAKRDFIAKCGLPDDEFYADAFTSEADKHGG